MSIVIDGRPMLTSTEATAKCLLHPQALARKAAAGVLRSVKIQGRMFFEAAEIEALATATPKGNGRN